MCCLNGLMQLLAQLRCLTELCPCDLNGLAQEQGGAQRHLCLLQSGLNPLAPGGLQPVEWKMRPFLSLRPSGLMGSCAAALHWICFFETSLFHAAVPAWQQPVGCQV